MWQRCCLTKPNEEGLRPLIFFHNRNVVGGRGEGGGGGFLYSNSYNFLESISVLVCMGKTCHGWKGRSFARSLRSRRLEVMGARKNGAREGDTRWKKQPPSTLRVSLARSVRSHAHHFQAPTTQAILKSTFQTFPHKTLRTVYTRNKSWLGWKGSPPSQVTLAKEGHPVS